MVKNDTESMIKVSEKDEKPAENVIKSSAQQEPSRMQHVAETAGTSCSDISDHEGDDYEDDQDNDLEDLINVIEKQIEAGEMHLASEGISEEEISWLLEELLVRKDEEAMMRSYGISAYVNSFHDWPSSEEFEFQKCGKSRAPERFTRRSGNDYRGSTITLPSRPISFVNVSWEAGLRQNSSR